MNNTETVKTQLINTKLINTLIQVIRSLSPEERKILEQELFFDDSTSKENIKASTRKDVTSSSENATPEDSVIYADFSEMATDLEYQQEALELCGVNMTRFKQKKTLFQKWDSISVAKAQALRKEFSQEDIELAESGLSDYLEQLKREDQA